VGEIPVADLKRRHIKAIVAGMSDRPHAARRWLIVIRKMISAALDEEWIESDPAYRLKYRPPPTHGWRAWTWPEMKAFEERWPIGSTPRLCYALTLWLGPRRKDVAALATASIDGDSITFTTHKTGRVVSGHITPMLREVLDAADLSGPTILKTAYGQPFSEKSLTGRMADWTRAAGLAKGCTIHGLRKTLGTLIADSGGSSRQAMAALGHDDLKQAELYSEASDRRMQARDAMLK
jgi:integrase